MDELKEIGFSMQRNGKGWIYHAEISDKPLDVSLGGDDEDTLDLSQYDDDDIIEAVEDKLCNLDAEEKYEFVLKLMKALK